MKKLLVFFSSLTITMLLSISVFAQEKEDVPVADIAPSESAEISSGEKTTDAADLSLEEDVSTTDEEQASEKEELTDPEKIDESKGDAQTLGNALVAGEGFGRVSAPQDPEAFIKGIQGQYEADLFTGSATFSYPLWIPAGRNGVQPRVALQYSSSNSNLGSEVGLGWTLPTSAIYRTTPKGVDKLYSQNDFSAEVFGSYEELIVVDSANGVYGAKTENDFGKYVFANNTWTLTDTRGTVYTFGASAASRQSDPNDSTRVYKWLLTKVQDTNGNFMTFTYFHDAGQVYPDTVRYTGHGVEAGLYEIRFVRSANVNPMLSYRTGFAVNTNFVLSAIEVYSYESGSAVKTRSYALAYDTVSHASNLLSSIMTTAGNLSLPPIQFSYYTSTAAIGLLRQITYPNGGKQSLSYQASTAYRTPAQGLANTNLPFIVQTIHTSVLEQTIPGTAQVQSATTMYDYSGGHYYFDAMDAYTREYAGFYQVQITDPEGNIRKLYFHQSEFSHDNASSVSMGEYADHISKKGKIFREEQYDDAGNLFTLVIRKWDKDALTDANPDWDRFFPKLVRETIVSYDGNADAKAVATELSYDQYGNTTQMVEYGEVSPSGNDGSFTDLGSDKITTTYEYAANTAAYIVSLQKSEERKDQNNTILAETKSYYDGSSTLGSVSKGNLTKSEQLLSSPNTYLQTALTYNAYGLPTVFTNARDHTTTISYDTKNLYPAQINNAKNQSTQYSYDYRFGVPTESIDPNGLTTTTVFDSLGRVTQTKVGDPAAPTQQVTASTIVYNTTSLPQSVTVRTVFDVAASGEQEAVTYYDGFGRPIQIRTEAEGSNTFVRNNIIYDVRGNVGKELLPVFASGSAFQSINGNDAGTEYTYDALSRVTSLTNAVGTTSTNYDQWTQRITDANGHRKDFLYDARGNLAQVKEYLGATAYTTTYSYDGSNFLTRITDANGNIRNMSYDLLGRRLSLEDLHTSGDTTFGTWTFTYDANGNLAASTDPKNQTMSYTYDELDRVLTEDFNGATGVEVTYTYDQGQNGIGRLGTVTSAAVTKQMSYDILGRVVSEQKTIAGQNYTTQFAYNLAGNPTTITSPSAITAHYTYNAAGLLESVDKGTIAVITNLDTAPNGLISRIDYANGVSTTNTYDLAQIYRLTHKQTVQGTTTIQDISYTFDPVGNITEIVESSDTNVAKAAAYTYDDLDRLLTATITDTSNAADYTHTFSYDILGNILSKSDVGSYAYAGGNSTTSSATVANPHAATTVSGVNYSYDANGNLTSDTLWNHTWDYKDRLLTSADGVTTVSYEYDEGGQRVRKYSSREEVIAEEPVITEKTTLYINQYEDIEDGATKNFIYAGNLKVATWENDTLVFHHPDHLTGASADTDASGAIISLLDYFPYGAVRLEEQAGDYENDYKFTGKELDEDTGLYYYEARYYDAGIGRFVSTDPVGLFTPERYINDPQQMNMYAYVRNNPLKYVDETGEKVSEYQPYLSTGALYNEGDQFGEYRGIQLRSGGANWGGPDHNFQCVSLVKAFMKDQYGLNLNGTGHAVAYGNEERLNAQLHSNNKDAMGDFTVYKNGGYVMPRENDIISWKGGEVGHVAIIAEVVFDEDSGEGHVYTIDQNASRSTGLFSQSITRNYDENGDASYTVGGRNGLSGYTVQGWARYNIQSVEDPNANPTYTTTQQTPATQPPAQSEKE